MPTAAQAHVWLRSHPDLLEDFSVSQAHFRFWPARLPHAITVPATSLWDNLAINARRYPDKAALVFFDQVLSYA